MKIGIMGGTFDPIHFGHLLMAEQAREAMKLDQVWFIPTGAPPHKQGKEITAAEDRLKMVQVAIRDHPQFRCLDIEIQRQGPSYTLHTVQQLTHIYPKFHFYLIMGADMVKNLPQWYKIEEILQLVGVIGLHRPGYIATDIPDFIENHVYWVEKMIETNLSSTFIKEQIQSDKSVRYMIPDSVYQYIKEQSLYGS